MWVCEVRVPVLTARTRTNVHILLWHTVNVVCYCETDILMARTRTHVHMACGDRCVAVRSALIHNLMARTMSIVDMRRPLLAGPLLLYLLCDVGRTIYSFWWRRPMTNCPWHAESVGSYETGVDRYFDGADHAHGMWWLVSINCILTWPLFVAVRRALIHILLRPCPWHVVSIR